ncbi:TPA: helix-turn-helix transcriptional regulator [Clostridioides difficile]|uniref:helix-turn-helix transcriptional regulator n=2 Tax=Clostridioides difficile TaxID=1496 RepID=UPI0005ACCC93|nr:DNA-binding protein [Clostridioides difficile]KAK2251446.1 DNA-binding protein [Clostridioides difficile]KAK2333879.1 DNA-binding protein [Clostridioides difficile]KAK2336495.1 DNA-binding protein [Clostridioides difficile]KAK2338003.1 DNA-binding protein [Clostridioides difficile]
MAKRPVPLYDFKAFGAAIKAARNEYGESRKKVSDELYISPRYLANIENKLQYNSVLQQQHIDRQNLYNKLSKGQDKS